MNAMREDEPRCVLVTSPMRTGSTWLVEMLQGISQFPERHFVTTAREVSALLEAGDRGGVVKSHEIVDLDWQAIPPQVPILRITRNFKDSLISRILYERNIRPSEGLEIKSREIRELVEALSEETDAVFVRCFLERCRHVVIAWLSEIVVMERTWSDRCLTITYESLMHNPYEAMAELTECLWGRWPVARNRVSGVVRTSLRRGYRQRDSFLRSRAVGVGGWETYLTCELSEKLEDLYFSLQSLAREGGMRWSDLVRQHGRPDLC